MVFILFLCLYYDKTVLHENGEFLITGDWRLQTYYTLHYLVFLQSSLWPNAFFEALVTSKFLPIGGSVQTGSKTNPHAEIVNTEK